MQPAASYVPNPNNLGDLTDRHNRAFSPRFANDFRNNHAPSTPASRTGCPTT